MPTPSTFYYNSTVFCDATDIWTDNDLTTPAPDGWYQVGEVYRQKTGGVLGPCNDCPSCGPAIVPCDGTVAGSGGQGVYRLTFNAGTDVGACVVKFNPKNVPDMLTVTYNGVSSSEYSSYIHGYKEGYIGRADVAENIPAYPGGPVGPGAGIQTGSPVGPYPNVDTYAWNTTTGTFLTTGGTETIPQVPGSEVNMTATGYNITPAFTVIPKTDPTVSLIECLVYGPDVGTEFVLTVYCPKLLNEFECSSPGGACGTYGKTLYTCSVAPVPGTGTHNMLMLYDWVFTDAYGASPYPAGDVSVLDGDGSNKCITVDTNGVITNIVPCAGTC